MILYDKGSTIGTAEGTTFTLNDTAKDRLLRFLKYDGNTTQTGTPTPTSPIPINNVTGDNVVSVNNGDNLFDINWLSGNDITIEDGVATGQAKAFRYAFGIYGAFIPNTNYGNQVSISIDGYTDGNSSSANNNGLRLVVFYTDGTTQSMCQFSNNQTTKTTKTGTSNANKTIANIQIAYGNAPDNIWHLSNVMITYGTTPQTYKEYVGKVYEINLGKNLFTGFTKGIALSSTNGTAYSSNNAASSDYIPVDYNKNPYYYISGLLDTLSSWVGAYNSSKQFLGRTNGTFRKEAYLTYNGYTGGTAQGTGDIAYLRVTQYVQSGGTGTIDDIDNAKVQLEVGGNKTSYSPYKPPIELNKINNYVDFIDKSKGKNLFDTTIYNTLDISGNAEIQSNGYYKVRFPSAKTIMEDEFDENTQYTISCYAYGNASGNAGVLGFNYTDGTSEIKGINQTTPYLYTITSASGKTIKNIKITYGSQNVTFITNIQLEKGNQATEYEPYGTQWYIKKSIGKVVLDGSEASWGIANSGTANWYYRLSYTTNIVSGTGLSSLCNYYPLVEIGNNNTTQGLGIVGAYFRIRWGTEDTITNFKTWLNTHNVIIYYPINTPTYTIITDNELVEQLEALYNAVTYDNVTNILQSNTGLPLYTYLQFVKPLDFSRNGLGYLNNVLSSQITDEINGEYSLTFEYPMSEPMASEIVEDRYVKEKVADGTSQIFVIRKIQKDFDKMSVYCTHLFYLLNDDFLEDVYPQNLSPKPFLDWILAKANYQLPFIANSDIATTRTARYVRKNVVESILGDIDNSMYSLWGMELKRDNWNIGLKARLGADKGEKLIFGKNITGINLSIDTTGIYTRIMPIGFDGLILPEKYIDADNINDYPYPRICLYQFSNIRYDPNDPTAYQTLDDAYQALRDATQELFNKGINRPSINVQIDWVELSKTEEYKQYSALERVDLGDTIHCEVLGMNYDARVIKTIYNALTDRIDYFEIGSAKPSITSTMNQLDYDIVNLPSSMLDEAQANATQLITQAMGGYVYKTNSELYIMDNPDPNQAVKVWRWNINGLGYSSTGINGTYGIAMTMDGSIVADFITTGQLNANVISASTIIGVINGNTSQLKLDADQIDLTATDVLNILAGNSLNLTSKNITIDSTNFSVDSGGNMTCSNANITGGYLELTDDPDTYDDRLIIKKKNSTEITTATSEYIITKKAYNDDDNYAQMSLSTGFTHSSKTDANNYRSGGLRTDRLTLSRTVNGVTTDTQITGNSATFGGDVTISGDIYNKTFDMYNDTSGNDWQTMMKNKIDYCIANINTNKTYAMAFINGGWQGVDFGFGIYSKIGTMHQLVFYTFSNIFHCRYDSSTGNYAYYQYI